MGIDPRGPVRRISGWKYVFLKPIVASVLGFTLFGTALVASAATERPVKIVAFGDSLTAGHGLPATDAFPFKLAHALEAKGIKCASAEVTSLPTLTVPLSDPAAIAALNKLTDALEEHDDVKEIHSNAEFPGETA